MENIKQTYGVPALLSFFMPGLGQIIKGQIGKGILIFIGHIISGLLILVLIGLVTTPILFIWNIYDAYNSQVPSN